MILRDLEDGKLFVIKGDTEHRVLRRENMTLDGVVCTNAKGETILYSRYKSIAQVKDGEYQALGNKNKIIKDGK